MKLCNLQPGRSSKLDWTRPWAIFPTFSSALDQRLSELSQSIDCHCMSVIEWRNYLLCLIYDTFLYSLDWSLSLQTDLQTYCLFPQLVPNYRLLPHLPSLELHCLLEVLHLHIFRSIGFNLLCQISWLLPFTVNRSRINCTGTPEVRCPKEGDCILTVPRATHTLNKHTSITNPALHRVCLSCL